MLGVKKILGPPEKRCAGRSDARRIFSPADSSAATAPHNAADSPAKSTNRATPNLFHDMRIVVSSKSRVNNIPPQEINPRILYLSRL